MVNVGFFEALFNKVKCPPHLYMINALTASFSHVKFNFVNQHEETSFFNRDIKIDQIQSTPTIWLFELRLPVFWNKISILVGDTYTVQDRKIGVLGYQDHNLAFSTIDLYREWNIADPNFDPEELIKRIEALLPRPGLSYDQPAPNYTEPTDRSSHS
jgi:hypothetical protein